MNTLLTLQGKSFTPKSATGRGPITIPADSIVTLNHLNELYTSLERVKEYWSNNTIIDGVLVSVYYNRVLAKSNRIDGFFNVGDGNAIPNETIVGAKFSNDKSKHIITHYISKEVLDKTIEHTKKVITIFKDYFTSAPMTSMVFSDSSKFNQIDYSKYGLSKSKFKQYLRDACFVKGFGVEQADMSTVRNSIVTIYDVKTNLLTLLKQLDIDVSEANIMDQTTVLLDEKNIELLLLKAPYLVSMIVEDFSTLSPENFYNDENTFYNNLPFPTNEPIIGVIDTLFDDRVYFNVGRVS